MSPNEILNNPDFINHSMELVFKWLFVIGATLYMLFTLVVIRQISLMKKTLITEVSPLITTLGLAHFGLAIGVLVYYFLFLQHPHSLNIMATTRNQCLFFDAARQIVCYLGNKQLAGDQKQSIREKMPPLFLQVLSAGQVSICQSPLSVQVLTARPSSEQLL